MSTGDQTRKGDWMQVYGGKAFYPLACMPEDIDFGAIGNALGKICRYGGHTKGFYSVAEHTVLMSRAVSKENALWALVHDAAEAYVGDMVRPLKNYMPAFREVEDDILSQITTLLELPGGAVLPDEIKEADARILLDERAAMLHTPPMDWGIEDLEPLGVKIEALPYYRASYEWFKRFRELTGLNPSGQTL